MKTATKRKKKTFKQPSQETAKKYGITLPEIDTSAEYLSPNEVGEILNLTGEAVKQWIYTRRLPAVKLANGYWKIRKSDLEAYLADRAKAPSRPVVMVVPNYEGSLSDIVKSLECTPICAMGVADFILKMESLKPALVIVNTTELLPHISNKVPVVLIGVKEPGPAELSAAVDKGVRCFINMEKCGGRDMVRSELQKVLNSN